MNKIKRGSGFRGLLDYLAENRDGPAPGRFIGGTMSGTTPCELAAEFKASRQLRPDIKKPVWHNSLRMPAGEDISDEKWGEIARRYAQAVALARELITGEPAARPVDDLETAARQLTAYVHKHAVPLNKMENRK